MGTPPETSKQQPCPDKILDDIGSALGMGVVGGSTFHFLKALSNAPKAHLPIAASQVVCLNAPRLAGSFAVWGRLFSTFNCSMVYLRHKKDPWNSIFAGAAAGGFISMRQGLATSARSAVFDGVLLALIEGTGIMLNKFLSAQQPMPIIIDEPLPPNGVPAQHVPLSSDSEAQLAQSWIAGFFCKKDDPVSSTGGSETKVLESFDVPPVPNFECR